MTKYRIVPGEYRFKYNLQKRIWFTWHYVRGSNSIQELYDIVRDCLGELVL